MKIIITESQARKLRLIGENIEQYDIIAAYENECKNKSVEIDKDFLNIMSMSVDEVINKKVDFAGLYNKLSKVESASYDIYKKITDRLEGELSEDEFYKIEGRLYTANNLISDKVSALNSIIESLVDLQTKVVDEDLLKNFAGVKPLDITDGQSF